MKNAMKLLDAIGQIQDTYIMDAHSDVSKSAFLRKRFFLIAAIVAVLLLAGCAAYAWHWYTAFFTTQRKEPLSNSQISYINENAQDIHESQSNNGYTIELKSAIAESKSAYITLGVTAPEDVDLSSVLGDEKLVFRKFYVRPVGSELSANLSYRIMDDGDGKNNTVNIVLGILPGGLLEDDARFGEGSPWEIILEDMEITGHDREYEEELLRTKYAGMTDYMLEDDEAARVLFRTLLAEGKWEFEVELSFADHEYLELLSAPISTKAVVTRKDRSDVMLYSTANAVEDLTITSIQLRALGATVVFEVPETKEGSEFPDYFCTWIDMGDTYNPLTRIVSRDENFFVVLKDGTRIDFRQREGAVDSANLTSDSPIVLKDVDYLQLSDGTKLYAT